MLNLRGDDVFECPGCSQWNDERVDSTLDQKEVYCYHCGEVFTFEEAFGF